MDSSRELNPHLMKRPIFNNLIVSVLVGAAISGLLIPKPIATTATNSNPETKAGIPLAYAAGAVPAYTFSQSTSQIQMKAVAPLPPKERFKSQMISKTTLDAWLDTLVEKESHGNAKIRIMDVNGRYSYGCLQFQMATFKNYIARYDLESEVDGDWNSAIYDCGLQRRLAKLMLLENRNNWRHWFNSVRDGELGLPPVPQVSSNN